MTEMKKIVAQPRVLPVILVLDTSASMQEEGKIEALNRAVDELREQLSQLRRSEDVDVRVGVLRFSTGCEWVTGEELVPEDELKLEQLEADGMTDLGPALRELNAKLSRQVLFRGLPRMHMPVIVFMTDGMPNDDWRDPLAQLWQNKWYKRGHAIKIGVALGDDADVDFLAELVGGEEHVARAADGEQLRQLLVRRTMDVCRESVDVISARTPPEPRIDGPQNAADRDVWEEAEDT